MKLIVLFFRAFDDKKKIHLQKWPTWEILILITFENVPFFFKMYLFILEKVPFYF
jgi:hypothetical protein